MKNKVTKHTQQLISTKKTTVEGVNSAPDSFQNFLPSPGTYRLVPDLRDRFCPIFVQEKNQFLSWTVSRWFDENILNQFYILIIVVDEKNICIIPFTGEKEKFRMCLVNFVEISRIKGYHVLLTGATKIPAGDTGETK